MPDFFDDMERLSREAAESLKAPAKAPEWDSILNRLNQEMPVKKKKRRFILFFLSFLICLSISGYFIFNNLSREKTLQVKHNTVTNIILPDTVSVQHNNKIVLNKTNAQNKLNTETKNNPNIVANNNQKTKKTITKKTVINKQTVYLNITNRNKDPKPKNTTISSAGILYSIIDSNTIVSNKNEIVLGNKISDDAQKLSVADSLNSTPLQAAALQTDTTKNIKQNVTDNKNKQTEKKKIFFSKNRIDCYLWPRSGFCRQL